jgi:hypothetical protein
LVLVVLAIIAKAEEAPLKATVAPGGDVAGTAAKLAHPIIAAPTRGRCRG